MATPHQVGIRYEKVSFALLGAELTEDEWAVGPMIIDCVFETVDPFREMALKGLTRSDAMVFRQTDAGLILAGLWEMKYVTGREMPGIIERTCMKTRGLTRHLRRLNGHLREAIDWVTGGCLSLPEITVPEDQQITLTFVSPQTPDGNLALYVPKKARFPVRHVVVPEFADHPLPKRPAGRFFARA